MHAQHAHCNAVSRPPVRQAGLHAPASLRRRFAARSSPPVRSGGRSPKSDAISAGAGRRAFSFHFSLFKGHGLGSNFWLTGPQTGPGPWRDGGPALTPARGGGGPQHGHGDQLAAAAVFGAAGRRARLKPAPWAVVPAKRLPPRCRGLRMRSLRWTSRSLLPRPTVRAQAARCWRLYGLLGL